MLVSTLLLTLLAQAAAPIAPPGGPARAANAGACAAGVVRDDGSAETGYGWVPSVVDGIYVQEFALPEAASQRIDEVCICWLRTGSDDALDFEVVFYGDAGGRPALEPFAAIPATASGVPFGIAGAFYTVPVGGLLVPSDRFYVGARWNANVAPFFFVCVDTTPATAVTGGFFIDDRAQDWGDVLNTADPIFDAHRAMLVRLGPAGNVAPEIPVTSGLGAALLALLLVAAGLYRLRR